MVIDPGDHRQLDAAGQIDATHDVHLPQLHRARALPALVVVAPTAPRLGFDELVPHEAAVDRRTRRNHLELAAQFAEDRAWAPTGMSSSHRDDQSFELGRHLVRTAIGFGAAISQGTETFARVTNQPAMKGPSVDAVAGGDVGDVGPGVEHLPDG